MTFVAYVGIGSNQRFGALGPEMLVAEAMQKLESIGRIVARSSLFETQPVGFVDQPNFVNAAATVETSLAPDALLRALIEIERLYGRDRSAGIAKGPRTLDLDLLLVESEGGGVIRSSPSLTLPHPELAHRRFVLAPLAEIAPQLRHPVLRTTMAGLLAALPNAGANASSAVRPLQPMREKSL